MVIESGGRNPCTISLKNGILPIVVIAVNQLYMLGNYPVDRTE
jgi:hypothetical protein